MVDRIAAATADAYYLNDRILRIRIHQLEHVDLLLPVVAGALDVGPAAFFLAAAGAGGLDAYLFASGAEVPFIGLSAGVVAGLLLVPLTVVSAGVGVALASLKD